MLDDARRCDQVEDQVGLGHAVKLRIDRCDIGASDAVHRIRGVGREAGAVQKCAEIRDIGNRLLGNRRREMDDCRVTLSDVEAAMLREHVPPANVHVVPWAVEARATPAAFDERSGLVFVGDYRHRSDVDAALRLIDEIMPLVWRQAPDITCTLIGSEMPEVLKQARDLRIVALSQTKDLAACLCAVRMTIAPLVYGAGLQAKVLDSLAAGVPCIGTIVAAEGFVLPGPLEWLVADDASGFASRSFGSILTRRCSPPADWQASDT